MDQFYEQAGSLFVDAYDAFYSSSGLQIAGDLAFYQRIAREVGGPVLELACGTGRIALPLAGADLPPMSKRKKGAITARDTVVVQCLQDKRSTVLALSRTLCAGFAGAAAFAAASLTAAARGALPGGRSGRRDGRFRSNKGMEPDAHAPAASRTS